MSEVIAENKKAYHDYDVIDKLEAGIQLTGTEVKSLRMKRVSLSGSYVQVLGGELWLIGSSISPYYNGSVFNHKMVRDRKLICHLREISSIKQKTEAKGLTAIPLKLYWKNRKIKLLIGIARGKNNSDKRMSVKDRDIEREIRKEY